MAKQENFKSDNKEELTPDEILQRIKHAIANYKSNRHVKGEVVKIKLLLINSVITLHFKKIPSLYIYPVTIAQLKNEIDAKEVFENFGTQKRYLHYSQQTEFDLGTIQHPSRLL